MFVPIIMAGGAGTRLWPLSRQLFPKQFHALTGTGTMLQQTVTRLDGLDCADPVLICSEEHRFLAAEQMRLIGRESIAILLEPVARGTAPAIAIAALLARSGGDDPLLLVLAADHLVRDTARFHEAVEAAVPLAEQGRLVTFGVVPDHPETGYGYIRRGDGLGGGFTVERFEEKPDRQTAERYLTEEGYYWNSGMFMFRAGRYLEELGRHAPAILEACRAATADMRSDMQFIRIDGKRFAACPADSIDYAVMERTSHAAVVPLDAGWSDIGSWSALGEALGADEEGNTLEGDVVSIGSRGNLVRAESRLVAVVGVENLVVVETKDAVLVADRARVQEVKEVVAALHAGGRAEHVNHREVYRPWGHYDSVDAGPRHQVKRITVKPGGKLSVQMHHHRAEHWVVVRGTAKVQKGDETLVLTENQSTYIPLGEIHALENPGKIPLELIEVQSGSYLGEDDIVRFEDRYGRS
jgi:mannose-1-phosphate guanylyltransferase